MIVGKGRRNLEVMNMFYDMLFEQLWNSLDLSGIAVARIAAKETQYFSK